MLLLPSPPLPPPMWMRPSRPRLSLSRCYLHIQNVRSFPFFSFATSAVADFNVAGRVKVQQINEKEVTLESSFCPFRSSSMIIIIIISYVHCWMSARQNGLYSSVMLFKDVADVREDSNNAE